MVHPTAVLRARRLTPLRLIAAAVTVALLFLLGAAAPAALTPSQFHGVNWADPADNFADGRRGPLGPVHRRQLRPPPTPRRRPSSPASSTTSAPTPSACPSTPPPWAPAWWNSYTGAIDAATDAGFKVILGYWEGTSSEDGKVDNTAAWTSMWNTVVGKYGGNSLVYFEPMNEPHGYSATDWTNLVASWLGTHPSVPRDRVFVSGTGYDADVTAECAYSRLSGTYLALHDYGFWATHTYDDWVSTLKASIGSCAGRTVMDEFGAPMTTGENYDGPSTADNFTAFIEAATGTARNLGLGTVYWPGLRNGDTYSMETLHGSGTDLYLTNTNPTGVDRLEYAWGGGTPVSASKATTAVRGSASGRCLDVPGSSHDNSTQVELYDCNGGANQQWTLTPSGALTVYGSGSCLEAYAQGTAPGTKADVYTGNGGANQKWSVNADGTVTNVQSGLCLDATGGGTANGTLLGVRPCTGASNQQWTRS